MIISHKHRYLFIEVPHTASTSISEELRSQYDGISILHKHAAYQEFLRHASNDEKHYFVFAGVRNPLDVAVTKYLRHEKMAEMRKQAESEAMPAQMAATTKRDTQDLNFAGYFRRYYRLPFSDSVCRDARKHLEFVIRFEHLQSDFSELLQQSGIEQRRALPHINKTATKQKNFLSYYTPEMFNRAVQIFGPFMEEWGYELPPAWGAVSVSAYSRLNYHLVNAMRNVYWQHIKEGPRFVGSLSRIVTVALGTRPAFEFRRKYRSE